MSFDTVEDVIKYAIEKEIEAAAFYKEASEQEPYAAAKETFLSFAKEEEKHRTLLENLLEGKTDVGKYEFKWIPDIKRSNYMVEMTYEKGMPYSDMLRLAMKREEKALALYNELLAKADKEDVKNIFKMLCQEEAKHKLALETMYDDLMACLGD
jgi:rubrerythrin